MLRKLRSAGAAVALIVLTILYGCDSTGPGSTSLSILLTDAPGDVKTAVVTITQVYLQGGGDDECEEEGDEDELEDEGDDDDDERGNGRGNGRGNNHGDDEDDNDELDDDEACEAAVEGDADQSGRVVVSDEERTVDLLTLTTSTTELVSGLTIPAGRYSQLRLVITGGYLEVENADGTTSIYASSPDYVGLPPGATVAGELRIPSFGSSGLKVHFPNGGLDLDGIESVLLLDFDVAQSFGHLAGSDAWVMHPVVHGSREESVNAAQESAASTPD